MDKFINVELLKSPANWFTVFVMVSFGLLLVAMISPEADSDS